MAAPSGEDRLALDYLALRKLVGALGVLLPLILLVGGRLVFGLPPQPTLSAYHDDGMRDVFVGLLCALGVFLLAYRGYKDDLQASRIAGVAAIMVALFPHAPPGAADPVGAGSLACMAAILAYNLWLEAWLPESTVFWLESLAVWLFGLSWAVKGKALEGGLAVRPVRAFFTRGEATA